MTLETFLPFAAAGISAALAVVVLWRDHRPLANRAFIAGMLALAAREIVEGLSAEAVLAPEILDWQRLRMSIEALLPGTWLLFSLSFARTNYRELLKKWRVPLVAGFSLPLLLVVVWRDSLLEGAPLLDGSSEWVLSLGWAGFALQLVFLLSAVLILMNLESTLRASTGTIRWQIKFALLGFCALFAAQVYTSSQTLLYSSIQTNLSLVGTLAVLVANILILAWFLRSRLIHAEVYLSGAFLYNSLTILFVGVYLLAIGGLAKAVSVLGGEQSLPWVTLVVFLALVALATVLLSGQLQQRSKRFISRHLRRPRYDYRTVWSAFTQRTGSLVTLPALCSAIAKVVSETFGAPSVTIWLLNETRDELVFGGSTALSEEQAHAILATGLEGKLLIEIMGVRDGPEDLGSPIATVVPELEARHGLFFRQAETRYCAPLIWGRERLGFLTLNERTTKETLSIEDLDLLKTIADQAASTLLNLKLSERLLQAKEMEAFQTLSAFFIHDLKNLASRLSLTLQNLPLHYDDPAFRADLLKVISQSVAGIDSMCSRLSPLSQELLLEPTETDMGSLVGSTLASLNGSLQAKLVQDLRPVPKLKLDKEQIQKVLVNLVLNANEATGAGGEIRVESRERNGWTVLSVTDDGCGMTREFMAGSLFKPFHTTKKQGLGIGLFHSKKIVEAHGGRIEVESEEGRGSTFRVMLPQG